MRPALRFGLALLAGLLAAGVSVLLIDGAVDPTRTRFAAGLNAVVWTGFVALYVPVYDRFDGAPANSEGASYRDAAKWGGIAGGAASVGISGLALLLLGTVPGRYVAAVGLFVFGLALLSMAVGMGTVATNVPADGPGRAVRSGGGNADGPADD